MKRILIALLVIVSQLTLSAQVEFGIKAGLSSYELAQTKIFIPDQNINISIADANYGHHLGIYTRFKISALYLEPALLFNSNKVTYMLEDYSESPLQSFKDEKYNTLDIPVLLGLKFGPLRIQGGVVSHIFINSISDLVDIEGYQQRFQKATYGYQAGLGLDVWKLRFDVNYEGNLSRWGDHIEIGGVDYAFGERAQRIVATVGYKF
jgi:hypothetical protein